ncbi:hypothetical protein, partial [Actinobacillus pleuropneumoniae]|uniref:hypothetical protein n=1 Tax=Actinobacillus pleuropneumoniae TaxID=715 RepID=UPI00227A384A
MEYTAPLVIRDLMAAYPQYSIVHSKDTTWHPLSPNQKLVPRQLYWLLVIPNYFSLSKDTALSG